MNPLKTTETAKPELTTVHREHVQISQTPQTDAEAQSIKRTLVVGAPIGPGAAGTVSQVGQIPAHFEYLTNVGDHANAIKTSCGGCKHWDNIAWRKFVIASTGPASTVADRQTIETLRGRLATEGRGYKDPKTGKVDVEATLMGIGVCRVLSDWVEGAMKQRHPAHWPVAPMPESTCPTYVAVPGARMAVVTPAQPLGLFKARDTNKTGDARRDALLFAAAGKIR